MLEYKLISCSYISIIGFLYILDAVAITTSMSPTSTTSMSPTSATSMSLTVTLIPSQRPQGLAPGSLAGQ